MDIVWNGLLVLAGLVFAGVVGNAAWAGLKIGASWAARTAYSVLTLYQQKGRDDVFRFAAIGSSQVDVFVLIVFVSIILVGTLFGSAYLLAVTIAPSELKSLLSTSSNPAIHITALFLLWGSGYFSARTVLLILSSLIVIERFEYRMVALGPVLEELEGRVLRRDFVMMQGEADHKALVEKLWSISKERNCPWQSGGAPPKRATAI